MLEQLIVISDEIIIAINLPFIILSVIVSHSVQLLFGMESFVCPLLPRMPMLLWILVLWRYGFVEISFAVCLVCG